MLFSMMSMVSVAQGIADPVLSPEDGYSNVNAEDVTFTITFAEGAEVGIAQGEAGIIALYTVSGPIQQETFQVTSNQPKISINENVVELKFTYDLTEHDPGDEFFITVEDNALTVDGEPWGGLYMTGESEFDWDFALGDYEPSNVTLVPADDSTHVGYNGPEQSITTELKLIFENESSVEIVNGKQIALYKANGNLVARTITPDLVSVSGNEVTVNTSGVELEEMQDYYVRVEAGAFTDGSGNDVGVYPGQNDNTSWSFTAADVTRPTVTAHIDEEDLEGDDMVDEVEQKPTIVLEFDELLYRDPTGTEEGRQAIKNSDLDDFIILTDGTDEFDLDMSIEGKVVTISVDEDLATHTTYTIVVNKPGSVIAEDFEQNPVAENTEFEFKTGDFTAPRFVAWSTDPVTRTSDENQKLDIIVTEAMIDDKSEVDDATNGIYPQNGEYSEPLNLYVKVFDSDYDEDDIDVPTNPTDEGWVAVPYIDDEDDDNYEKYALLEADFDLDCDKAYDIYFYAVDAVGNAFDADEIVATKIDNFWSTDNCIAEPTLTFSDESEDPEVGRDASFVLTFEEPISFDAADYSVQDSEENDVTIASAVYDDTDGYTVTLTLALANTYATNASLETYTLTVSGDLTDVANTSDTNNDTEDNKLGDDVVFEFTIEDYEGPVMTFDPADQDGVSNSTEVPVTVSPKIVFSEKPYVYEGSSLVPLTGEDAEGLIVFSGPGIESVPLGDDNPDYEIEVDGNTVYVHPVADSLASESGYTLSVEETIYDVNGFMLNMYSDNSQVIEGKSAGGESVYFETEDTRTPLVTFTTSSGGLTDVDTDATIVITFDEVVRESAEETNIDEADENMVRALIKLTDNEGNEVKFNVVNVTKTASPEETVVEINPIDYPTEYLFEKGATYTVEVSGVEDDNANAIVASADFTIVEEETTEEMVVTVTPANEEEEVAVDQTTIFFDFDTPVDPQTGTITVTDGTTTYLFTDLANDLHKVAADQYSLDLGISELESATEYTITVSVDAFIEQGEGTVTWPTEAYTSTFTTIDSESPVVDIYGDVSVTSGDLTAVNFGDDITLTFNEAIKKSEAVQNAQIRILDPNETDVNNQVIYTYNLSSPKVTIDSEDTPNQITISLDGVALEYDYTYRLEITESYITDLAGNAFVYTEGGGATENEGGILDGTFEFTTNVNVAPEYVSSNFEPFIGEDDVAVGGTTVTFAFNEIVHLAPTSGSAQINLNTVSGGDAVATFDLLDPDVADRLIWDHDVANNQTKVTVDFGGLLSFNGFKSNTDYYVTLDPGVAFVDKDDNTLFVTDDEDDIFVEDDVYPATGSWWFTTEDLTDPIATDLLANDQKVESDDVVEDDATLKVKFSEPVSFASSYDYSSAFTLSVSDGIVAPTIENATWNENDSTYTLELSDKFDATVVDAAVVTLTVLENAFVDEALSPRTNSSDKEFTFKLEDKHIPGLNIVAVTKTETTTDGYEVNAADSIEIKVTITEPATVNYYVVEKDKDPNVEANVVSTFSVEYDDADTYTLYISELAELTEYDVYAQAVDASGNISDSDSESTGNQLNGPAKAATSDITAPTINLALTWPEDDSTIDLYTERYGSTSTSLKIYFSEEITAPGTVDLQVRNKVTNVNIDALTISAPQQDSDDEWFVEVTPDNGWDAETEYYVELPAGTYEDVPEWGAANECADDFYGTEEWNFTTGPEYVAPELLATDEDENEFSILPVDGATINGNAIETLNIYYTEPVKLGLESGIIQVYKADVLDDPDAPAQEIIIISGNVGVSEDGKVVSINVSNKLRSDYKEHYVIILPENLIVDAAYDEDDATTTADLTPFTSLQVDADNVSIDADASTTLDGDMYWDVYSKDSYNPNYSWSSNWEEFDHEYDENTLDNFPHSDAAADREDWLDTDVSEEPNRNIYLTFDEDIYVYNSSDELEPLSTSNFDATAFYFMYGDSTDVEFSASFIEADNKVIINPEEEFESDTTYTVSVKDSIFFDVDGNELTDAGVDNYVFTTWIAESPIVTLTFEESGLPEEGRATTQPWLKAKFNRGILIEANYQSLVAADVKKFFKLYDSSDNEVELNVNVISSDDTEFILTPVDELTSEGEYTFVVLEEDEDYGKKLVDDVRVQTMNGNIFEQDLEDRSITFTVEDTVEPEVATAGFDPAHENYSVDPLYNESTITVTFTEDIELGETADLLEIRRYYVSGAKSEGAGTLFQSVSVNDDDVSVDDNKLLISLKDTLDDFQGYAVTIPEGFVVDESGHEFGGLVKGDWIFATDDGTAPTVIEAYPSIVGTPGNIPVTADFKLYFDENVEVGTGNYILYKRTQEQITNGDDGDAVEVIPASDVLISGSDPVNDMDSDILTIPHVRLKENSIYYVRYDAGVVNDGIAGNDTPERYDFSWDFTTSSHEAPELVAWAPHDTIVSQEPMLSMTFKDPIDLGTGNVRIYEYFYTEGGVWNARLAETISIKDTSKVSLDGKVITIDPSNRLQDNIDKYYVLVDASAITNTTSGDFYAGIADEDTWYFGTVEDETAPVFVDVTSNTDCDVAPGDIKATIELTDFNGIAAGTGNFEVYYAADSTLAFEVPAVDARVEFVNETDDYHYVTKSTATITFDAADLEEETDYYVMVGDSAIFDNSNADEPNVFDGSVVSDWTFSVNDFTAPSAMLDMDTDFTASDSLVVTIKFSEEVQVGSAPEFVVATAADSTEAFTYTITEENINNDDSTVTVVVNGLDDMTDYYMAFDSSFVNDLAYGQCADVRAVEAIDANTWTFNTGDNTAPTATIVSPVLAETADTALVIEFSEAVNVDALEGYVVVNGDSVLLTSTDSIIYSGIITDLPSEATVEVVFPEGSFEDEVVGGTTNAIEAGTVLTFEVDDIAAPIAQYIPNGIYEAYYKGIDLKMAFDDDVEAVQGTEFYVYDAETDEALDTIAATDFTTSGDSIFTFTTDMPGYGSYYILADYGSFVDDGAATVAQNYEGITADTVWAFDVVDYEFGDCASLISPIRGETDVATTTTISLSFSCEEGIYPPVRSGRYISIGDQAEEQVEGENYFNFELADSMIDGTTLTLEVSGLKENTTYSITVAEGAVTDEAGNEFEGITNANDWIFTTGDFTPPVATLVAGNSIEGDDADATMRSTENGTLYLVEEGVTADVAVMEAAIDDNKAVKTAAVADTDAMVDVSGLVAGTYNAVAVDILGNVSVKSDDAYVIEEAPAYPVLTIAEIQGDGDETPYADQIVVTSGTVTGIDENGAGFFMQDANDARSGIYVYDSGLAANVGIGTSVKVTATATEYYSLTQLSDVISYEFTGKIVDPVAINITASEIGEDYEGVLVKVDSLKTTGMPSDADNTEGEWYTADTENDVDVTIDEQLFTYVPDAGQRYNITGVVNYTWDEYKLAPTQVEDIDFVSGIKMLDINIDIYPNPFDTYVKFDVSRDVEITKAVITNIAGQLVKQVDYPENTIRTDELRSGVYFISLQTEEGIAKTERIIKR
jgi:hypothetical protein